MRYAPHRFEITSADVGRRQLARLRWGTNFRLEIDAINRYFPGDLSPNLMDLLRIGTAVFVADRLVRRRRGWRREIGLKIEVVRPYFWADKEIFAALREAIEFVTGDSWEIEFEKYPAHYEWTEPLLRRGAARDSSLVCLYSGGLDSAAGLGLRLREQRDRLILPVTVPHQPGQRSRIQGQYRRLRRHFGATIEPLVVNAGVSRSAIGKPESSGRGRSVLFTALGGITAFLAGAQDVEVFESGIGAINLPLMAGMTGSMSTRSCHPEFLRRMSRLVSLVTGREITFRLPYCHWTKGEMVVGINGEGLGDLARATVSCAHYPRGHECYKQCGICSACIFRRQAMIVGRVDEPQGSYTFDLFDSADAANAIDPKKQGYLKAFLMQVARWDNIETTCQLPEQDYRYLRETQILNYGESAGATIDLLVRHRDEWKAIVALRRRLGFRWASSIRQKPTPAERGLRHASA